MLRITKTANGEVVFKLSGQMSAENIGELETLFSAEASDRHIILELKDLTLVDQEIVGFLKRSEANGIKLENCPAYIRQWIKQQKSEMKGRNNMKIVVIGGSGLVGSKLITKFGAQGHEAVSASPNSGVNTLTGEGLAEVLKGAQVVVDVSNSPSFEDKAVMEFFKKSTGNLLKYEAAAGVGHHVALSVVGTERLPESGYLRAKMAQEKLIKESSIPYSIVHATQFFEFVTRIADEATDGKTVRLPPVLFQPMAAEDVASAVARVAVGSPLNGTIEIGGPEKFRFDDLIRKGLSARNDPREVIADPRARYFGTELSERSLIPDDGAQLGETRFADWLKSPASQPPKTNLTSATAATATKGA